MAEAMTVPGSVAPSPKGFRGPAGWLRVLRLPSAMPGVGRAGVLAVFLAVIGGTILFADYKSIYVRALQAIDGKKWAEVIRLLNEAIRENATEGESIRVYGMRFEPYLPHYYLGLAHARLGDCASAVPYLQTSESQGAVRSTGRYKELVTIRTECQSQLDAAKASEPVVPPPAQTPPVTQSKSPPPPEPARVQPQPSQAKTEPPTAQSARTVTLTEAPPALPQPVRPEASIADVPAPLVSGAQAYFDGNYSRATEVLQSIDFSSATLNAQGFLFRAAARYALYLLGGSSNPALRQGAMADVQAVRRLDPGLRPDERYFSPRFVQFFAGIR